MRRCGTRALRRRRAAGCWRGAHLSCGSPRSHSCIFGCRAQARSGRAARPLRRAATASDTKFCSSCRKSSEPATSPSDRSAARHASPLCARRHRARPGPADVNSHQARRWALSNVPKQHTMPLRSAVVGPRARQGGARRAAPDDGDVHCDGGQPRRHALRALLPARLLATQRFGGHSLRQREASPAAACAHAHR